MRVLNVMSRFNVGGTAQWLYQLSVGLDENNIENLLIIGDCPASESEDPRIAQISHLRIDGLGPKTSPFSTVQAFLSLRREIKKYRPDIVNTHTSKAGVLGRLAAKTSGVDTKIVHTYHGHVLSGYFNPIVATLIRFIESILNRITDYSFVVGEKVKEDLIEAKIIKNSRILTVWPAVEDFSLSNRKELRESLGIASKALVVGWLGRKVPIKRIDRILEIAANRPEITFLVAGDGPSAKESFPELFKKHNLNNVFEFGYMRASDFWSIVDICIMTSDNEGMPSAPIEAALAKLPTITVDAGSMKEVLIDGETGFLCKPEIADLLKKLDLLARDSDLRESLGRNGREFALKKFSRSSSSTRQIAGYRLALASNSSSGD